MIRRCCNYHTYTRRNVILIQNQYKIHLTIITVEIIFTTGIYSVKIESSLPLLAIGICANNNTSVTGTFLKKYTNYYMHS